MLLESLQENRCITDLDISSNHAGASISPPHSTPPQPPNLNTILPTIPLYNTIQRTSDESFFDSRTHFCGCH